MYEQEEKSIVADLWEFINIDALNEYVDSVVADDLGESYAMDIQYSFESIDPGGLAVLRVKYLIEVEEDD